MAVKKGDVVKVATRQSQRAQGLTAALRSHGWRTHYGAGERRANDADYRQQKAKEALDYARAVERDAATVREWVEAWAATQGVDVRPGR